MEAKNINHSNEKEVNNLKKIVLITALFFLLNLLGVHFLFLSSKGLFRGENIAEATEPVHASEEREPKAAKEEKAADNGSAMWKYISAALAIGLTGLATSMAQVKIGSAGAGTIAEKPDTAGTFIVLVAIPETIVILGFVVAAMLLMF